MHLQVLFRDYYRHIVKFLHLFDGHEHFGNQPRLNYKKGKQQEHNRIVVEVLAD